MPELWFTADLHLGHGNIIKYCERPFLSEGDQERASQDCRASWKVSAETVERHDAAIIDAINERVAVKDTLWILGDFCLGSLEEAVAYRRRIHCPNVNFVRGNHDLPSYDSLFGEVIDQGMVKHDGKKIWLNHYPMRSWDKAFHGAWHLYGHVHGRLAEEDAVNLKLLARDVGVDAADFAPLSFTELKDYMAPREKAFWEWRERIDQQRNEN